MFSVRRANEIYHINLDKFQTKVLVDELALRQVFLPALWLSSCQCHSTFAPYFSTACRSYQTGRRPKAGNLSQSNALSKVGHTFTLVFLA